MQWTAPPVGARARSTGAASQAEPNRLPSSPPAARAPRDSLRARPGWDAVAPSQALQDRAAHRERWPVDERSDLAAWLAPPSTTRARDRKGRAKSELGRA